MASPPRHQGEAPPSMITSISSSVSSLLLGCCARRTLLEALLPPAAAGAAGAAAAAAALGGGVGVAAATPAPAAGWGAAAPCVSRCNQPAASAADKELIRTPSGVTLGGKRMPGRLAVAAAAAGAAAGDECTAPGASGDSVGGGAAAAAMGCAMAPSVPALSTVATTCPGTTVSCSFTRMPISLPSLGALISMVTLSVSTCAARHGPAASGDLKAGWVWEPWAGCTASQHTTLMTNNRLDREECCGVSLPEL
jgi:hypothetical protein